MKLFDWLKDKLKHFNIQSIKNISSSQKNITNLVIILCIGIIFLLASNFYKDLYGIKKDTRDNVQQGGSEVNYTPESDDKASYVRELEDQLSDILSKIEDAGEVSVMITLKSSSETVPAKDESKTDKTTNEKDTDGGTRTINESNTDDKIVMVNEQGGNAKPLIVKELSPDIKGVIVVAEGAKDSRVKLRISDAVQTVLDIPAFRVTVYERK